MKKAPESTVNLMFRVMRNPHLWIIAVLMLFLILVHYHELFTGINIMDPLGSVLGFGLTRNTVTRILFLIPVIYGTVKLGLGAGISLLVLAAAAMFPRVFLISSDSREALFETCAVILVGALLTALLYAWQKGKKRMAQLEATQSQLNSHIQKLSRLHLISNLINQSLEPKQVMGSALNEVAHLMDCSQAWLYLKDKENNDLKLFASYGFSPTARIETFMSGQGADSLAIQQLSPVIIEDVNLYPGAGAEADKLQLHSIGAKDSTINPGHVSTDLSHEGIQSLLVVPLISKGKANGTLGIGFRAPHPYASDEVDLLTAVADQFSIEIENAYLYQRELFAAENLRISEKNYRDIFENASDAIWIHDLQGNIIIANNAAAELTGYSIDELLKLNARSFMSEESLRIAYQVKEKLFNGQPLKQPYEQRMIRKDETEAIVMLTTNLATKDGVPIGFQHMARDLTKERWMQDNLRHYVQQITRAQEDERKRIARELHDETVQALVVVSRHLYNLASGKSKLSALEIQEEVQKISNGIRHYSQELRPSILDDLGLLPALEWLVSDLTKNYGIDVTIEITGNRQPLPPESELLLFRITQEALTNVRRHSQATCASVKVDFSDNKLRLSIQDNGKGFEMPSTAGDLARIGKLGLVGMQERAQLLGGTLTIDTQLNKGTSVIVEIPL